MKEFFQQLDACIAKYDLLCHPFYKAWAAGKLTREDLREYACEYYHHVEAFPRYLAEFGVRLEEDELRRVVLANMSDEKGGEDLYGEQSPAHSELWLDFAEGMGASRNVGGTCSAACDQAVGELLFPKGAARDARRSAGGILCLRVASAASCARESPRARAPVWRRRENTTILHAARYR
jgi:TENA/THI-4/PQQC family